MIHRFNGHTRLKCDECQTSDEFATPDAARAWADQRGWETVERGGGDVVEFEDHICDRCAAQKKWARAA